MEIIKTVLNNNHYRYRIQHCDNSEQYIVFLLGALQDIESVNSFSTHFANKMNCITIEIPGTGHTENLESTISIRDQATMLREFLRYLGVSSAHIIGFSYATAVAVELCDIWPHVRSMSICGGVPGIPSSGRLATKKMIAAAMSSPACFANSFTESLTVNNDNIPKNKAIIRATVRSIKAMPQERIDVFFENSVRLLVHTPTNVDKITAPSTICVGEYDPYVTKETATKFAQQLPNGHLVVINNADHLVHLQYPDTVARAMLAQVEAQLTLHKQLATIN
ncbi:MULTISPECIES: alpha/beta fold hydrolase [Vibrio]|uniref:Alpha/beta hydrolase n=2 Tax=Vibrio cyclitrophicus TaxID=47951 RepID=A0A7Z1MFM1_9VIBR|nr:alpha/beta hydrolase [Vibrio cyclitrophicus]PMP20015.1 alpha/beta hydrolase [Vibrio cyclitrophicus]PMP25198.1 alpha/beta hydrolase [Vibrio cyclitrophicus]